MHEAPAIFQEIKDFIGFTDADAASLQAHRADLRGPRGRDHRPVLRQARRQPGAGPKLIEGRVDALKRTHNRWMSELFAGTYEAAYFEDRWRIGMTHVRVGVKPWWVEAVSSFLRTEGVALLSREIDDPALRLGGLQALVKILDIDLMIINLAYSQETVDRLSQFTGMSRKLIERCIQLKQ
jgi:hypothetical protein